MMENEPEYTCPELERIPISRLRQDITELISDNSSGYQELEMEMANLLHDLHVLFKKKQASYGPGNISAFGEKGCVVRMSDKMQRLIRLVWEDRTNPLADETVDDTYLDMACYALIAILVRKNKWPK